MKALIKFFSGLLGVRRASTSSRQPLMLALSAGLTRPPSCMINSHDARCDVQCYLDTSTSMIRLKKALAARFNAFLDEITDRWIKTGGARNNFFVSQYAFNAAIKRVEDWIEIDSAQRWSTAIFDRHVSGGTALYDSIAEGCRRMIKRSCLFNHGGKKAGAVVFLTDGADNGSRLSLAEARSCVIEAQEMGILVFFCFIGSRPEQHAATKTARDLGVDGTTIITADATEAGLVQAFEGASRVMSGTWTGQ